MAETRPPPQPQDFDSYLAAQAHNLGEIRQMPEFKLVERVIALYAHSFVLRARDSDLRFLQLSSLPWGLAVGGRDNRAGASRRRDCGDGRAIEAASLAVAIKSDPAKATAA